MMEPDPKFKNMVKKSFILQKEKDLQIPLVRKEPNIKHHTATTFILSSLTHFLIYPFDTIKTRIIAKNKVVDVSHFERNKVVEMTTYKGIMMGYASIMVGNMCHIAIGRENLLVGAIVEGLLKTWIDMSKISKQMGNLKGDFEIMKKTFGVCAAYGVLRDIVFRTIYVRLSSYLHQKYLTNAKFYDERTKVNNIFMSAIAATIVSQPFEVCFIKAASQRSLKYRSVLEIPGKIIREEGVGKLMFGGLWARLIYNILSTTILLNTYEEMLGISLQVL